jgi:predicted ester cyclase
VTDARDYYGVRSDPRVTNAEIARRALESVCTGRDTDPARYYAPSFVDHVNDEEYRGLEGVARSVARYQQVIERMAISVEQQVVAGDLVTSRYVVTGIVRGRPVRFNGMTISHFEDKTIVEDWSVIDTLGLLRQLGLRRLLILTATHLFGRAVRG